ncbi:MAG: radical domain iron-sulfur cluster-binding oxidoreductase [Geobacteraceae bacterium]|nr:radical domain iron-sulfur cluster-binding oxidoreductase [Geobacteraceae bacterium]
MPLRGVAGYHHPDPHGPVPATGNRNDGIRRPFTRFHFPGLHSFPLHGKAGGFFPLPNCSHPCYFFPMSWKIIEKYRKTLAAETGIAHKKWGGKVTVCLVYPNHYAVAMSNLGFQAVYALFNSSPDILCERAFLPDSRELREYEKSASRLLSLESQRPLSDFDIIAFSVSFENDYLNIPAIFDLAGIPPLSAERGEKSPLVMGGGAALTLNPEPVADFLDLICIGEGEAVLWPFLDLLKNETVPDRTTLLQKSAQLPGIYVPRFYSFSYDECRVTAITCTEGVPSRVKRVWSADLDLAGATTVILSPETEFSDMYLVELSRGCPHGCRFCAAGYMYLPYRQRSLESLKKEVAEGLKHRRKVGLVAAAVSDFRGIGELSRHILECGGKVSVSSLRIDGLDEEMIDVLKASGHRTIALAPEGGSQRLRDLIGKNISEEQILSACDRLIRKDILNLKLYFIIGLPGETDGDLLELVGLVKRIREMVIEAARGRGRLGEVILSVNPFVPKPSTPFQWCGMENLKSLEQKANYLQNAFGRLSNVKMKLESLRDAYLQALLSRGDRRLSTFLIQNSRLGNWRRAAKELRLNTDAMVYRNIIPGDTLPWDVIDNHAGDRLRQEYLKAFGNVYNREWRA